MSGTQRCMDGRLIYEPSQARPNSMHLTDIIYCQKPGTEERPYERRVAPTPSNPRGREPGVKYFCLNCAAAHDLYSARLKLVTLRRWEEWGDEFMADCGHTRPVLTEHEKTALAHPEAATRPAASRPVRHAQAHDPIPDCEPAWVQATREFPEPDPVRITDLPDIDQYEEAHHG